ncbi:hypothetical protein ACJX0J_007553, partial [Zea mays]
MHTKKRNRLEHKRLNDLVYVSYNRKMADRFQKIREEGKNFDPLILEDFDWDNEWVDPLANSSHVSNALGDDFNLSWDQVDEAIGASAHLRGRNFPRRAAGGCVRRNEDLEEEETNLANEDDEDEEYILDDLDVEDEIEGSNSGNDGDDQGVDAHDIELSSPNITNTISFPRTTTIDSITLPCVNKTCKYHFNVSIGMQSVGTL